MLRLDHNYIERLEECEFAGLNMLNYLDISNNKIKSIYALRVLPSLDDLYVARNRVTDLIGIFHFKRLQELDIAHNRLCSLDGFQGHMRITILRLSHNRLSDVVIAAKLPSLLELDISHNRLHSVATMRDQFVNLEALNVSHNRVNSMQDLKTLAVMPNLVELSVKGNPAVKGLTRKALLKAIPRLMVLNQRIVKSNVAAWKKSTSDMASDVSGAHLKMVADEIDTLEETTFAYKTALEHKITRLRIAAATLPGPQPRPEMEEKPESLPRLRSRSQMARSFPLSSKDSMEFNF
ncbi:PREDICTED: internalin-A-like isoform X1 [Priapulus caudatus]|uniref:Internalin-A-like isoform X1 n=1 Tax=Priapulus caudatus TaxID=37621 RepID=A0ABM1ET28_PRICU|nr:PREDICTED: internalin-A-like isoform X1 [Priapulus caudatus]